MRHAIRTLCHGNLHDHCRQLVIGVGLLICAGPPLNAATLCVDEDGKPGCMATISAAVAAASPGDTIVVDPARSHEEVVITKSLSHVASRHGMPVIDATGLSHGIFLHGLAPAPNPG